MSEWRDHRPELVDVREHDDGRPIVVMELRPADADVLGAAWDELRGAWLDLPPHPNILDAIDRAGRSLLVRFAAIDWRREPLGLALEESGDKLAGAWGVQLCKAYEHLAQALSARLLFRFICPMVLVDLDEQIRLGFLPASPCHPVIGRFVAPEARGADEVPHEAALVFLVGRAMSELTRASHVRASTLTPVIERCLDPEPRARFQTLRELRRAFRHAGPVRNEQRTPDDLADWADFEEELGWRLVHPPLSPAHVELPPVARHAPWATPNALDPPPPGPARAHYLDGKAHFRAARLAEARESFERALALDPRMIEAMLLRREVDRLVSTTRAAAGHQDPPSRDVDEALAKSARLEAQLVLLDE